jgi:uncharacterized RDD family membrane protein YckC
MTDAPPPIPAPDGPPPIPGSGPAPAPADAPPLAFADPSRYGVDPARLAHPALRAAAFVLDGLGTFVLTTIVLFSGLFGAFGFFGWLPLLVPLLATVLDTALTATRGVTVAKAMLRLRVVDADTGRVIGAGRAILRSLVIVSPLLLALAVTAVTWSLPTEALGALGALVSVTGWIPILGWVALLVVLAASPRYRGLQDRAARSIVVRR